VLIPIPKTETVLTAEARKHLVENKIIKADVDLSRERDKKELLEFIHESTYSITEQIFDNFVEE